MIYLKTVGHASEVWFTLGLTGLAVIGSLCHDEALCGEFHLSSQMVANDYQSYSYASGG